MLDFEPSQFALLQQMITTVEPYDKLWHTVLKFTVDYDVWFYGPFKNLDADAVCEEVENMWRTLYKLAKTFFDNPGAKRIAEMIRVKVEKFKYYVPLLQSICNKGLQQRHWDMVISFIRINSLDLFESTFR